MTAEPLTPTGPATDGPATDGPGTDDATRRQELAAFLRSRRERITPEQAGLPRGPRRRTPGLRREEVAHLSAVGVTWYTWLEQGRPIRVSAQVLDAIARALLMDQTERVHLFALAGAVDPRPETECPIVTGTALRLMHRIAPYPATLQNARYDVLAHNRPFAQVFGDLAELPQRERNCLWLLITSRRWREICLDRDETLRDLIAKFRAGMAEHVAEPAWKERLDGLLAESAEFRELWGRHELGAMSPHVKRYAHPGVGLLSLEHRTMWLTPESQAYRLVAYVPADDATEERLERLAELGDGPGAG
ncbi:helix-turn-helix transcriptional regulator [Streptomyces spectabilis]|uniref:Helix-turn-helix domain-containing protein n=1 Tax=Streptomyces spectabilis TaxID=68270 RepID=A0A516RKZ2_STRST|nr:helix-turn-helix transcriptional regulator [Streptomyces spectabilis]QDQ16300.1 helix-turn-helix domain-containing protein [Streptomyces spectabilis]